MNQWLCFRYSISGRGAVHGKGNIPASVKGQIPAQNGEAVSVLPLGTAVLEQPCFGVKCRIVAKPFHFGQCNRNDCLLQKQAQGVGFFGILI